MSICLSDVEMKHAKNQAQAWHMADAKMGDITQLCDR